MKPRLETPVVQFGTSRFLQAHADLFFSEGHPGQAVTVVQSSGDPTRARRLAALASDDGYPVRIRGVSGGKKIDEERRVTSVRRTLSTEHDWPELVRVVSHEATMIISNTGDRGFEPRPADRNGAPSQDQSYPAKLYHLLAARHCAGQPPLTIFPMELVAENGSVLCARVMSIAHEQGASAALTDWLARCIWANSLVDRIVSKPIEPAGAVAEPYALWAIEAQDGLAAPVRHPAVKIVEDLEEIARLKLHILNLGHTALAAFWMAGDKNPLATVRDLMAGPVGQRLRVLMQDEVIPGFAVRGKETQAQSYLIETLERFQNPFLDHLIRDIAENHAEKVQRRIVAFLDWVRETEPDFAAPELDRIVTA